MSQTSAVTQYRIRDLIDDQDKERYAISSIRMATILTAAVQNLAGRTFQGMVAIPDTVSLSAGTSDYTLTGSPDTLLQVIRQFDGLELVPRMLEEINARYGQDTDTPASRGDPQYYAAWETNAQSYILRVAPTPSVTRILLLYRTNFPASTVGDTTDIPFSPLLLRGLEAYCAAKCALAMSQEERDRRKLGPEAISDWQLEAQQAVINENWRQRFSRKGQDQIMRVGQWPL